MHKTGKTTKLFLLLSIMQVITVGLPQSPILCSTCAADVALLPDQDATVYVLPILSTDNYDTHINANTLCNNGTLNNYGTLINIATLYNNGTLNNGFVNVEKLFGKKVTSNWQINAGLRFGF